MARTRTARPFMTRTITLPVALSGLLLLLSGCASTRVAYDKPGITQAERQQDMNECLRAAMGTSEGWGSLFRLYQIDREDYGRCLEARDYTPTPASSPQQRESVQAP